MNLKPLRGLIVAAQYLETVPVELTPQKTRACLRRTFDLLPVSHILLGWDVPPELELAVADETTRHNASLLQWHPLLTGESGTPPEWRTINLKGKPIPGFHDLPEFTFVCPNHPDVQDFVSARVENVIQRDIYQGLFLDRIRFPSPAASPDEFLGCFCSHCCRVAREVGFDLKEIRRQIEEMISKPDGRKALIKSLFVRSPEPDKPFETFLRFRADTISRIAASISERLRVEGMEIALDCFSPSLAWMVGQDLGALDKVCDWIKVMTYPRTNAPAGLPFELLGLLRWLQEMKKSDEVEFLRDCSGFDLPQTIENLAREGLPSEVIRREIGLGKQMGVKTLLAGLALVDLPGINRVDLDDLTASQGADGIVLSWDLQYIALDRLGGLPGVLRACA